MPWPCYYPSNYWKKRPIGSHSQSWYSDEEKSSPSLAGIAPYGSCGPVCSLISIQTAMNSSSDLLTSIKFKKYSSNSLTTVLNEIPAFQATNHISISCFVSAVEESVQIWYHIHNFRTFFRTSWQPNIQIPSRTTTQCSTSLTALFVHTTETETSHVFNYKQYIIHTLILDTGFEFAGHTDPFSGDDADELSESAPLFEVSFIFLTWEVDGKEILNSLEFLNKTW